MPEATFHTPFKLLGIPPEGCSSVHFKRIMPENIARGMLYKDLKLSTEEAKAAGMVYAVYPPDELLTSAQSLAERWIVEGKKRVVASDLKIVNELESVALADTVLSKAFLQHQGSVSYKKGKVAPAVLFFTLAYTRFLWKHLLLRPNGYLA